jgi:hypothetical protein
LQIKENKSKEQANYGERLAESCSPELLARMKKLKLTPNKISALTKLGKNKTYRIIWGVQEPTLKESVLIAKAMQCSIERLYELLYESDLGKKDAQTFPESGKVSSLEIELIRIYE